MKFMVRKKKNNLKDKRNVWKEKFLKWKIKQQNFEIEWSKKWRWNETRNHELGLFKNVKIKKKMKNQWKNKFKFYLKKIQRKLFLSKVFICVALLLGVSAEKKEKKEAVEASKKQDKRGIYDHDFGGHDFGGSSSFGGHDFGGSSYGGHDFGGSSFGGHAIEHHPVHEKTVTLVKKVPGEKILNLFKVWK